MADICPICQTEVPEGQTACPTCGFKLIGTTQRFYPVPLDEEELGGSSNQSRQGILRVIRGPRTGVEYRLNGDEFTVGRSPQCTIFLNDMTVSRMHATISKIEGSYIITDANSFNGVWVNNKNVASKVLEPGDYVQIGAFSFKYEERDKDEE